MCIHVPKDMSIYIYILNYIRKFKIIKICIPVYYDTYMAIYNMLSSVTRGMFADELQRKILHCTNSICIYTNDMTLNIYIYNNIL
jgi:hypothetical protein